MTLMMTLNTVRSTVRHRISAYLPLGESGMDDAHHKKIDWIFTLCCLWSCICPFVRYKIFVIPFCKLMFDNALMLTYAALIIS